MKFKQSFLALLHNSCIYLSHNLLTLSSKYKYRIPGASSDFSMIYVDQSLILRQVGTQDFLNHMKKCIKCIIYY